MPDQGPAFESHRAQFVASLVAVAESLRACAQVADVFAKLVTDTHDPAELMNDHSTGKGKRKATAALDESEPKKRKRTAKPKDPNAPKRPASSYILFQNQVRKELKEKHPELSNNDLLSMIAEQWKTMSDDQKETYNQAMKTAKAQYSEEKKAYDNRTPEEVDAANAAAMAAAATKKATKPRGPKAANAVPVPVQARPPPAVVEASPGSDSSDDEGSEDDGSPEHHKEADLDSDDDSEEDQPAPPPKKKRAGSAQPTTQKSKKSTKA